MKNLKSKLIASVAMLLVSAVMLTSASFAWFTISTAPEIKGITTTVVTNETLEIALDKGYANEAAVNTAVDNGSASGDYYTWGNLVDLGTANDGNAGQAYAALDKTLRPVKLSSTDKKFFAPTYGTDGRISNLTKGLTAVAATGTANGFGLLIEDADNDNTYDTGEVVYGYYIDYWMRSNVGGAVTLSTAADRDASSTTTNTGEGSTFTAGGQTDGHKELAKGIRIAFQDITSATPGNITEITPTVADGSHTGTFSGTVINNLTANTAAKIRVYIYLDGASVTNAAASFNTTSITGALNLQFTISGVDKSMLTPPTTGGNTGSESGGNTP